MTKRKASDMAGCSAWKDPDVIIISDSEEEPVYTDVHEAPAVPAVPAPVVEGQMDIDEEEEDPEEDPHWDEEAAVHDAAVLDGMDQQVEAPVWDAPEPLYDLAWDEPALGPEYEMHGDAAMEGGIQDLPHPAYDFDAAMVVEILQAAMAELQAVTNTAEIHRQIYEAELAATQAMLAAEQRRNARLTTSLEAARAAADGAQARTDRLRRECVDSFMHLADDVSRYPLDLDMPPYAIGRQVVQYMATSLATYILRRF